MHSQLHKSIDTLGTPRNLLRQVGVEDAVLIRHHLDRRVERYLPLVIGREGSVLEGRGLVVCGRHYGHGDGLPIAIPTLPVEEEEVDDPDRDDRRQNNFQSVPLHINLLWAELPKLREAKNAQTKTQNISRLSLHTTYRSKKNKKKLLPAKTESKKI